MTDRPILFSGPMIRALLAGTKTQTRRTAGLADVNESPDAWSLHNVGPLGYMAKPSAKGKFGATFESREIEPGALHVCPQRLPIAPGDLLWVKETWRPSISAADPWHVAVLYPHDGQVRHWNWSSDADFGDWRIPKAAAKGNVTPLFMPRWASRLTLTVTDVRVERLQDITYQDTLAEGIEATDIWQRRQIACLERNEECGSVCRDSFRELWESINGAGSWDENPWVAAYTFDVHRCNIDRMDA